MKSCAVFLTVAIGASSASAATIETQQLACASHERMIEINRALFAGETDRFLSLDSQARQSPDCEVLQPNQRGLVAGSPSFGFVCFQPDGKNQCLWVIKEAVKN